MCALSLQLFKAREITEEQLLDRLSELLKASLFSHSNEPIATHHVGLTRLYAPLRIVE